MRRMCLSTHLVPFISHVVPPTLSSIVWNSVLVVIQSFNPLPDIHPKWDSSLHKTSKGNKILCTPVLRTRCTTLPGSGCVWSSCRSIRRFGGLPSGLLAGVSWTLLYWHWRLPFLTRSNHRDWRWFRLTRGCLLRSRPTCHGIRRTVIDTARGSLVFRFFCIILRLDPCRTGPLPPHSPSPTSPCLIGLMPRTPPLLYCPTYT